MVTILNMHMFYLSVVCLSILRETFDKDCIIISIILVTIIIIIIIIGATIFVITKYFSETLNTIC